MTYSMAKMIMEDNINLAGKVINHDLANIVIEALFAAGKHSSFKEAKKIYDEILKGTDNRLALVKAGMLQEPLDVYVAGLQFNKPAFIPLSLVAAHVQP